MTTTAPDIGEFAIFVLWLVVPLLAGVCAVLCFIHRRLSPWLPLAGAGFLLETLVGIGSRVVFRIIGYFYPIGQGRDVYGLFFLGQTLGYILAFALILLGLALGLGEIGRRMRRLEQESGGPRLGAEDAREQWQPRKEGSQDIQT
jgi:hypothetical protein